MYADNERLETQVSELTVRLKTIQKGQLSPLKESNPGANPADSSSSDTISLDHKIIDLEESIDTFKNKLRAAEDKETTLNKKINNQKERIVQITSQVSELTVANSLLKEEVAEYENEKKSLELELEQSRAAQKLLEEKYAEQVKQMEKMLQKRARLFKPVKKVNPVEEKIDLSSHISSLKKTGTNFLESNIKFYFFFEFNLF